MARYNGREDAELERSFRSVAGKYARKKQKKKNSSVAVGIVVAGLVLLVAVIGIIFTVIGKTNKSNEPASLNMTIAGLDISGMSKKEVLEAVEQRFADTYDTKTMTLTVGEDSVKLSPELTGASLDAKDYVDALFFSADPTLVRLSDYLNLDKDAIVNALQPIANENTATLENGSITTKGILPDLAEKLENVEHMILVVKWVLPAQI